MWKAVRIFILLFILATVAQQAWLDDAALDWERKLYAVVYPINVDGDDKVAAYIQSLRTQDFDPVTAFFAEESARHGLGLDRPIEVSLGAEVKDVPPAPPDGGALAVAGWSLRLRYFAWRHSPKGSIRKPHIRLYLLFHDPRQHEALGHSTALSKGRIGRVNQFGGREHQQQNLVILAHELLHTLKATDKYDLRTTQPIFPDGYAEPDKSPRYPQQFAEVMGGRVPLAVNQAQIPASLRDVLVGEKTAREIGWVR